MRKYFFKRTFPVHGNGSFSRTNKSPFWTVLMYWDRFPKCRIIQVSQPAVPGLMFNAVSFTSLSLSPHLDKSQSSTCAKLDLFLNYYTDAQGCASWGPKFRSWAGRASLHLPLKYPHLSLGSSELLWTAFLFRGLSVATVLGMHLSFCTDRNLYPLKSHISKSMIVSGLFP